VYNNECFTSSYLQVQAKPFNKNGQKHMKKAKTNKNNPDMILHSFTLNMSIHLHFVIITYNF